MEFLKGAYDGVGRERGQKSSKRSVKTMVHSACIISGQELPTIDNALLTRVITLEFSKTDRNQEERELGERLERMQDSAELSNITAQLLDFRPLFEQRFAIAFEKATRAFMKELQNNILVKSRILSNMAVLYSTYSLLKDKLEFPFSEEEFFQLASNTIVRQSELISSSDEVTTFWDMVDFMVANYEIQENVDFVIEATNHIKVMSSGSQTVTKTLDESKRVIYLSFTKIHPLYMEAHRKRFNKVGLGKSSMLHYLKNHPSFLGAVKSKRIGEKNTSCFAFDYEALPLSIEDVKPELDSDDQKFFENLQES